MKKTTKILVSIAVLTIILVVAEYFAYDTLFVKKAKQESRKQETTTTTQPDETANWPTYENEKFKFSVKYPEGWFAKEATEGTEEVVHIVSRNIQAPMEIDENDGWISINTYKKIEDISLEEWVKEKYKTSNITIENHQGKKIVKIEMREEGKDTEPAFVSNAFMIKGDYIFEFSLLTLTGNAHKGYAEKLDQIVKSFQ